VEDVEGNGESALQQVVAKAPVATKAPALPVRGQQSRGPGLVTKGERII